MSTSNKPDTTTGKDEVGPELVEGGHIPGQPAFDPKSHGLSADFRLTNFGDTRGNSVKLHRGDLQSLLSTFDEQEEFERVTDEPSGTPSKATTSLREDASITKLECTGMFLLETSNVLCPVVDDPYLMGRIACASVLGGLYSLGVADVTSTRMTLAISERLDENERNVVTPLMIRGFKDAAGCVEAPVRACRILGNPWCTIGGTAAAVCSYHQLVPPDGATVGDVIVLTKPLGTVAAVTVAEWMRRPDKRSRLLLAITEEDVAKAHRRAVDCMLRTNRAAAVLMRKYNAHAACEVAAQGILGHAEALARRQRNSVSFVVHNMPVIAKMSGASKITGNGMPLLQGLMPEVSGGLLVVLPREQAAAYCKALEKTEQRQAWIIGIVASGSRTARVIDRPRVIEVPARETDSLW